MATKYPTELNTYGITVNAPIDTDFQEAIFPEGWTYESSRDDIRHCTYSDPDGKACFRCFIKLASYDKYISCQHISEDESQRLFNAKQEESVRKDTLQEYIKENFSQEWSEVNRFVVYYYRSGYDRVASYMSGCPRGRAFDDAVAEFSVHKLIGFTDQFQGKELSALWKKLKGINTPTNTIRVRELPNGVDNLHRFEMRDLLGIDPNMKNGQYSDERRQEPSPVAINYEI